MSNTTYNLDQLNVSAESFLLDYYQHRGPNPIENIQQLVYGLGKALGAAAALYNRLEEDGLLHTWAIDSPPPGFAYEDKPQGHICYDETILRRGPGNMTAVAISDLDRTEFCESDCNVKQYGLKSYLGFPVALNGKVVGSLAVVFGEQRDFTAEEKQLIEGFAKALTLEEERKYAIDTVRNQLKEIHHLNEQVAVLTQQLEVRAA